MKDISDVSGNVVELPDDRRQRPQGRRSSTTCSPPTRARAPKAAPPPTTPPCARSYIIGPDKKIKAMLLYPMSTGRNFDEVLRLLDSDPANRQAFGGDPGQLEAGRGLHHRAAPRQRSGTRAKFPDGWKTVKPYLRTVPQPVEDPNPSIEGLSGGYRIEPQHARRFAILEQIDSPSGPCSTSRMRVPIGQLLGLGRVVAIDIEPDQRLARQRPEDRIALPAVNWSPCR